MPRSVAQQLDEIHPQMLRAKSEPDPQELGKRVIGQAISRAIEASGLTKQEVAFRIGYTDSGVIGRWINGSENPQFAKLWIIEELRGPLVIALAQLSEQAEIVTTISLRKVG